MSVFTVLAGFLGVILGVGLTYGYFRKKFMKQAEDALKAIEKWNHTLKSEEVANFKKEGDKPETKESTETESPDSTSVAPSSNISKEKEEEKNEKRD